MFCSKCGKEIKEEWKFCNYCGNEIKENEKQVNNGIMQCRVCGKEISYNENGTCEKCNEKILERIEAKKSNNTKKSEQFSDKVIGRIKAMNKKVLISCVLICIILIISIFMTFSNKNDGTLESLSTNSNSKTSSKNNKELPSYIIKSDTMPNGCVFNFDMSEFIKKYNKVVDEYSLKERASLGDYAAEYIADVRKLDMSYFEDYTYTMTNEEKKLAKSYAYKTKLPNTDIYDNKAFAITVDLNNNVYSVRYISNSDSIVIFHKFLLMAVCDISYDYASTILDYCSKNEYFADEDYCIVCGFTNNTSGGLNFSINPIIP